MKTGNRNSKNNMIALFWTLFLGYLAYGLCIIPSYLLERSMEYSSQPWAYIDHVLYNSYIGVFYSWLYYKIWNCQEMCSRRIPKIMDRQESGGVMRELL